MKRDISRARHATLSGTQVEVKLGNKNSAKEKPGLVRNGTYLSLINVPQHVIQRGNKREQLVMV